MLGGRVSEPYVDEGIGERLPAGDFYLVPMSMADNEKRESPDGKKGRIAKVRHWLELIIEWRERK
jgi:hypothetical protein